MLDKAYVEITNICNLNCEFCAGHKRKNEFMTPEKFNYILNALDHKVKYLYLHLMGEPLLHPQLNEILALTEKHNFKIMLTTNGTLLKSCTNLLLSCKKLYKLSISLHSFEGNNEGRLGLDEYLENCFGFAEKSAENGIITVFRLWNKGGVGSANEYILNKLHMRFPEAWSENRSGERLREKLFLEWGAMFKWPDEKNNTDLYTADGVFCQALRDQFGVLVDGTVVPCCLDHDGVLALGNIFDAPIEAILSCERATNIYDGFTRHEAVESYCIGCRRPCTYLPKR